MGRPVLEASEVQMSQLFNHNQQRAKVRQERHNACITDHRTIQRLMNWPDILPPAKEYVTIRFADNGIGLMPNRRKNLQHISDIT
jgi:hypothetical protein